MPPFVSPEWLTDHLDEMVVVDCRWSLDGTVGRGDYLAGHVPGAVFADLDSDLAAPPSAAAGRHPLPAPSDFAASMARLGIGDADRVVAYDQGHGAIAARLVWMLRITGHDAAVLDGGIEAWGGPRESGVPAVEAASFTAVPWPPDALVTADDVVAGVAAGRAVIDARARERYRGDVEVVDARPGHVPGAVNLPHSDAVGSNGRVRSSADLRAWFSAVGAADGGAIVYCGSGVTACMDVLAAEHAGLPRPRLFVGSWSAWSRDPDRPAVVGPAPFDPV